MGRVLRDRETVKEREREKGKRRRGGGSKRTQGLWPVQILGWNVASRAGPVISLIHQSFLGSDQIGIRSDDIALREELAG